MYKAYFQLFLLNYELIACVNGVTLMHTQEDISGRLRLGSDQVGVVSAGSLPAVMDHDLSQCGLGLGSRYPTISPE